MTAHDHVQIPSHPELTSASKAAVQLEDQLADDAARLSGVSSRNNPSQNGHEESNGSIHRSVAEIRSKDHAREAWADADDDTAKRQARVDLFQAYASEGKHAAFNAYSLQGTDEGPDRDDSQDPWKFEVLNGFFRQSDPSYPRMRPEEMLENDFGLVDESPEKWAKFKEKIKKLQAEAPEHVRYKVLFCGRHGEGWHNFGAQKYDPLDWELDWARKTTDGVYTWGPDAELTPTGQGQALDVQKGWKAVLKAGGPKPELWWCSPLTRTADTMRLSFGDILNGEKPIFVEDVREIYGVHTCDQRRSKSYLVERFPNYVFEDGFAEEDPWWKPEEREMEGFRRQRLRRAMFKLWNQQPETYVSITSHSCALRSLLAVLHHTGLSLETGEMIPIVVKGTKQT